MVKTTTVFSVLKRLVRWQHCKMNKISKLMKLILLWLINYYYGSSKTEFKTRLYNHNQSFKYRQKCNATKLSKALWQAKGAGQNPDIE